MGRRLPCRPRRTLSALAVLVFVGCVSFYAGQLHEITSRSPPSAPASIAPSNTATRHSPQRNGSLSDTIGSQSTAGDLLNALSTSDATAMLGTGGGSMCLASPDVPKVDISAERLTKMERCLAIPPQVVRKPSKVSLDTTSIPMLGMQAHPRTAAAVFVGKRNVMAMNYGLKDRGVAILASIYNVSRMSKDSRRRLERADFIYTNDREQMSAVRAWQDRNLATAAAATAVIATGTSTTDVAKHAMLRPQQHVITNTVEAFFSHSFTSKDGLPSSLRRCVADAVPKQHQPPPGADSAEIERCDRWFLEHGVVRHGGIAQGVQPRLLLKPTLGSQGKGITLHANLSTLLRDTQRGWPCDPMKNEIFGGAATVTQQTTKQKRLGRYVVQRYIEPLLLHGRKFDMRMYVLVASTEPVVLFWREGYIRRAMQPYDPTVPFAGNEGMHITNTHRQKKLHEYRPKSHIWSMAQLREYLGTHNGVEALRLFNRRLSTFVPWAARVVVQALLENQQQTASGAYGRVRDSAEWVRNGTYQMIGLDFMVDEDMQFSFIEGNPRPGLDQETKWQRNYMVDMVGELVELVFEIQTGAPLQLGKKTVPSVARHRLWNGESVGVSHAAYGNWRMLWHERWEECGSVNYSPLNLCPGRSAVPHSGAIEAAAETVYTSTNVTQQGASEETPSATAASWPCLFPRGTIPYDNYPAAVRRRDAEDTSMQASGNGESCAASITAATASVSTGAFGLQDVVIIGTSPGDGATGFSQQGRLQKQVDSVGEGLMGKNVARQHNCACLHSVLSLIAPPSVRIQIVPPTTPATLNHQQQEQRAGSSQTDWRTQLVDEGLVANIQAKLLKPERLSDLATALSHIQIWKDFASGKLFDGSVGIKHVEQQQQRVGGGTRSLLVLEDDASLSDDFCWSDITKRLEATPAGWTMVSLFEFDPYRNRGKKKRLPKSWDSTPLKLCPTNPGLGSEEGQEAARALAATVRVRHHGLGMVGYVLSHEGASRLLRLVLPLKDKAIDQVLTDVVRKQRLHTEGVFVSHPPLVHHDYLLGSQRREQNKAASKQAAVEGDDAVVELALAEELGITNDGSLMATTSSSTDDALMYGNAATATPQDATIAAKALEAEGFAVVGAVDDNEEEIVRPDVDSDPVASGGGVRVQTPRLALGAAASGVPTNAQVHLMSTAELEAEVLSLRAEAQARGGNG